MIISSWNSYFHFVGCVCEEVKEWYTESDCNVLQQEIPKDRINTPDTDVHCLCR